jgi:hypothetical protein
MSTPRVENGATVLSAVGPTAQKAMEVGHPDLPLLDEFPVEASVCMFDVRDEADGALGTESSCLPGHDGTSWRRIRGVTEP